MRLAIIGGTGVHSVDLLPNSVQLSVDTPYGETSVAHSALPENDIYFLTRHGSGHICPPHKVNYRANVWALRHLGVQGVIATSAVGSLRLNLAPGELLLIDSFLDFTSGRPFTFFDGDDGKVIHTDMTYPYCNTLRGLLANCAQQQGIPIHENGCYVCTNGPRYETAAEIRAFAQLGGDVVGMTGVPEVVLARELGLCYASVALITNFGAGLTAGKLSHNDVVEVMHKGGAWLRSVVGEAIRQSVHVQCTSC